MAQKGVNDEHDGKIENKTTYIQTWMKDLFHLIHRMPYILQVSKKCSNLCFFTNKEQVERNRQAGDDH